LKTAVSSYSFSRLINSGSMTQLDCVAKAKEMGFDAIEFVDIIPHDGSTVEQYAEKLGQEARSLGIEVTNFTFGADFITGSGGDIRAEIDRVKRNIDIAVLLGASGVRHDATSGFPAGKGEFRGFDNALAQLADACREITEHAAGKGIRTMVENHGFFCQDSDRVEKLVNTVAHPNFGLLVDMGNFLCADENPVTAVGRTAPYAFYAHAKDFHFKSGMMPNPGEGYMRTRGGNYIKGTIIGHGDVPIRQCIAALKSAGYNGAIAIEFEGMEDVLTGIRIGLANLRRYIQEVE
jgi:sugar phosphate isomerase/epimerase